MAILPSYVRHGAFGLTLLAALDTPTRCIILTGNLMPARRRLASTRRTDLAYQQGGVTARECRAVGIHIGFGPVLDVNTERVNPIIGIRSYSENPTLVAQMAQAYMQGANAEGLAVFPRLAGQHGEYLFIQLQSIRNKLRASPVMHGLIKELTDDEIVSLAAYLESK